MPKLPLWCRAALVLGSSFLDLSRASSARAETRENAAPKTSSVYTADGLLGPVRFGPTVGLGAPDGLRFGLFTTWKGLLGAGGALSFVPSVGVPGAGPAQVSRFSGEAFLRVHPFRGAFFAGLAGGMASTEGTTSKLAVTSEPSSRVDLRAVANVVYLAPHAGFRWMLAFGMTLGLDAGVEIPIVATDPTFDAVHGTDVQQVPGKGALATAMTFAATRPVPVLHFLEVGYAF